MPWRRFSEIRAQFRPTLLHMRIDRQDGRATWSRWAWLVSLTVIHIVVGLQALDTPADAATQRPHTKEHPITIDATALDPPTWWYVPGVTPLVWNLDPDSTEAMKTTDRHELQLKPGAYRFGTFTFDFPFTVTLDGKLDFAGTLDQCVSGRGTSELKIRCSKTQPYGGQPEYWGNKNGK